MPWQGTCPIELRMRLVNALVAEEDSMTALCEERGEPQDRLQVVEPVSGGGAERADRTLACRMWWRGQSARRRRT